MYPTRTTTALLDDLTDTANQAAWSEIDRRYRPVLVRFGRRLGLEAEDAADAAQDALTRFFKAYREGRYERGRGRLSSWIVAIGRNCIVDRQRFRISRRERAGQSQLEQRIEDDEVQAHWNEACDHEILRQAMGVLASESNFDPRTIEIFELVAIRGLSARQIATDLGVTENDVYLAKHRCLKRLRNIVVELESAFADDD